MDSSVDFNCVVCGFEDMMTMGSLLMSHSAGMAFTWTNMTKAHLCEITV